MVEKFTDKKKDSTQCIELENLLLLSPIMLNIRLSLMSNSSNNFTSEIA